MRRIVFGASFAVLLALLACKGKKKSGNEPGPPPPPPTPVASPPATPTPPVIPPPKPTPTPSIERKPLDVAQLFSGVTYSNKLFAPKSENTASAERKSPESYMVEVKVTVERPRASSTLEDFRANDPALAEVLAKIPGFPGNAQISPAFDRLYSLKESWIKARLSRLDQLLSRHNYYDCDTVLEFAGEGTGRKVILLKGDMDVNTDGSDGDRNVQVDDASPFFQPQTSYRWKKTTDRVNPFLEKTRQKLKDLKAEYAVKGLSAEKNRQIKEGIETSSRRIYDLQTWSFLVSAADPAIVLPGFMLRAEDEGEAVAQIGDYAVVLYGGTAYPAIVGDAGPSFKFGEGSLRLCKELNPVSSANARPVSDLNVAYLVFPGSADPAGPPDLDRWNARCAELLAEIGLKDIPLHNWENIVPAWPTPTPSPTPEVPAPASPESNGSPDATGAAPESQPTAEPASGPSPQPETPAVSPAPPEGTLSEPQAPA